MDRIENLLSHLSELHTTEMGVTRIRKNLGLESDDVVSWCKDRISDPRCQIEKRGKNWYAVIDGTVITVNAFSHTIITAHKTEKKAGNR